MKICRRILIVLFLLVVVAQAKPAQQPLTTQTPACPCSVEVVVRRLFGDETIPDAQVTLLRWMNADSPGPDINANALIQFTNKNGSAMFRYLEQGRYTVIAKRDGFTARSGESEPSYTLSIPEPPGFRSPDEGTPVDRRIMLSLVLTSDIVGTLHKETGEPATGITMAAFRVSYSHGRRLLNGVKATETNQNGEYRLGPLPDGEYYLRTDQPYSPVYFPGTVDPALAVPVILQDGRQITIGDFKLPKKTGVTISGTVTADVPGGDALSDGRLLRSVLTLYLIRSDGLRDQYPQVIPNTVEGNQNRNGGSEFKFEVQNVAPGSYDLYPVFVDTSTSTRPLYFTGKTVIEVGTDDSLNIHASIHPQGEVTCHVTVIGTIPVTATRNRAPIDPIQCQFDAVDSLPQRFVPSRTTSPSSNGTVRTANLIEGQYVLDSVAPLAGDFYVSEMRQGGRDFSDEGTFDIQSGVSEPIEIVIRSGGAAIHGTVQKPRSNSGRLVLIPDPPRRQNRLYYRGVSIPPSGHFDLTGIAPGTYKLFAWDSLPDGAESDPKFLEQFEAIGVRVTVAAGTVLSDVAVPLILATN